MNTPPKITVCDFSDISQLEGNKTYSDLPIVFEGTMAECHNYCEKTRSFLWHSSQEMIFGGYYVGDDGACLMLV